ncbi:MAG: YkgJ family cysteine cluster protein [Candidatus Manganitrophus sp.]|nr:YkgJ family cysteine cluster protein [Candidatus Manganitrophus sp.]WDT73244.1 MAG: YkgJ family cysteine cluster protein [Candidatus Manganitrophus sp.]
MTELTGVSCDGCGACCEEQGMPPGYLFPALIDFLPEALRKEIEFHQEEERRTGATRFERGLPCIWYDLETKRCRHYDYRPDICREIPVGGRSCLFWRERRLHHL